MTRAVRLSVFVAVSLVVSGVLVITVPTSGAGELAILAGALVAGELFELRPIDRPAVPMSFAIVLVLVRATTPAEFVVVVFGAYFAAVFLRPDPTGLARRLRLLVERVAGALLAASAYWVVLDVAPRANQRALVLGALATAALTQIAVHDAISAVRAGHLAAGRASGADVALVTTGVLMAVGYRGIGGQGRLGLWGVVLFSVLLLAAWYSFELLASTRRNFLQTVRALGIAPELGGLVRPGHIERVAELAVAVGRELDLGPDDLEHLETAALLHHLGAVCLDEPPAGSSHDSVAVAHAGAQMLRASETLAPAGDIVAAELLLHRPRDTRESSSAALAGQVLKVASAFDELTDGNAEHAAWAVEALFTGPNYVYDGRVLDALERVVVRRGLLAV